MLSPTAFDMKPMGRLWTCTQKGTQKSGMLFGNYPFLMTLRMRVCLSKLQGLPLMILCMPT